MSQADGWEFESPQLHVASRGTASAAGLISPCRPVTGSTRRESQRPGRNNSPLHGLWRSLAQRARFGSERSPVRIRATRLWYTALGRRRHHGRSARPVASSNLARQGAAGQRDPSTRSRISRAARSVQVTRARGTRGPWHRSGCSAAWLARVHGVHEAAGSNPASPTRDHGSTWRGTRSR